MMINKLQAFFVKPTPKVYITTMDARSSRMNAQAPPRLVFFLKSLNNSNVWAFVSLRLMFFSALSRACI